MNKLNSQLKQPLLVGLDYFESRPGGLGRAFESICEQFSSNGQDFNRIELGRPFLGRVSKPEDSIMRRILWLLWSAFKVRKKTSYIYSHFALHGFIVSLIIDAPIISFFHGPWAHESSLSAGIKIKKFVLQKYIEKQTYIKSKYVHCASVSFKELLVNEYGIEPRKIIVVPLGVNLDRFKPIKMHNARNILGLDESDFILVAVRRLTNRMGIKDLIQGFSLFHSQGYTGKLFIIGRGPQYDEYQKQIDDLGMANHVKMLGAVSDSELPIWYAASDASIVPSLDLEGFGLVALESLACGTPVLASRCGGLEEIIEKWNGDFLFDPARPDQICSKLAAFSEGELSESRSNCRKFATTYTWGRSFEIIKSSLQKSEILFLSSEDLISGAELSLFELVTNLDKRIDFEVFVGGSGQLYKKFVKNNVPTKTFSDLSLNFSRYSKKSQLLWNLLKLPILNLRMYKEVRKSKADILFVNTFKTLLVMTLTAILSKKRFVFWAHDSFNLNSNSQFCKKLFYKTIFKISNIQVICNSEYTAQTLKENIGVNSKLILYPIIRNDFGNIEKSKAGTIKLGIVGRIAEWKGQLFAIKALEPLLTNSDRIILEILGSPLFGDDRYFEELKDYVVKRKLSQKVVLHPFCEAPEKIYAHWDLTIHSSISPEPFGRSIVESLMVGIPVLVPEIGGPAEIVKHGENGLTYKLGDEHDLYRSVIEFIQNPRLRKHLESNAKKIELKFNKKIEINKFESWLEVELD